MHSTRQVTLLPAAARTSTTTGDAVSIGATTRPITQNSDGFSRHMMVFLGVTAAVAGTLDLTIEGSLDGATWYTLAPASAWSQVATTAGQQCRRYEGPIPNQIRAKGTQATAPNHTYSVVALLGG